MRKTVIVLLILLLSLLVACDVEAPQTPDRLVQIEAESVPLVLIRPTSQSADAVLSTAPARRGLVRRLHHEEPQ